MTTSEDKMVCLLNDLLNDDYTQHSEIKEPGAAILIVINDRIVYQHCFGWANTTELAEITCDTNFRLASLTKQFTAHGIILLEQQGKLSLQHTLDHFFANVFKEKCPKLSNKITIQHLLDHSSGIFDFEDDKESNPDYQWSDHDVLDVITDKTYFEPGSQFRYSNTGYILLGLIIETVTSQSLGNFFQKYVFEPCGIQSSILYESAKTSIVNRALGYAVQPKGERQYILSDQSSTSTTRGDGGIYMSINDYLRWYQYAPLIKSSKFLIDNRSNSASAYYSLGWFLSDTNEKIRIHSGNSCGFTHQVFRIDEEERRVLVLYLSNIGENAKRIIKFNRLIVEKILELNPNNTDLLWKMAELTR